MIFVECYPDKALVRAMGFEPVHSGGKGRAIASVLGSKGRVCLVDLDDERSMVSIRKYVRKEERMPDLGIRIFCLNHGIVIALENRLEDFIITSAREAGISLDEYGFHNDAESLHLEISKRRIPENFPDF